MRTQIEPVLKKPAKPQHANREAWLVAAIDELRPLFDAIDAPAYPEKLRVSCGWPKGGGRKAIGQCFPSGWSKDGFVEMFISPELDDPLEVLATLVHELIHALDNCESKHRGFFRKTAIAIGLEGKMTATVAGEALLHKLNDVLARLGTYPHSQLRKELIKKQGTRMVLVKCPKCGWQCRTTKKHIDVGVPTCFCGTKLVPEVPKGE